MSTIPTVFCVHILRSETFVRFRHHPTLPNQNNENGVFRRRSRPRSLGMFVGLLAQERG